MVFVRVFLRTAFIAILITLLAGCKARKSDDSRIKAVAEDSLRILCLESFVSSGLSGAIIDGFITDNNVQISIHTETDTNTLIRKLQNSKNSFDLVIGIDNSFALSEDISDMFEANSYSEYEGLSRETLFDRKQKLIPYAYGYLSLIYNQALIPEPPESFGELQDAKYYNQLAAVDPTNSGIGRAILYWTVALFGEEGYQPLWRSLRKNIVKVHPDWNDALKSVTEGNIGMAFGFSSSPNWYLEYASEPISLKASIMREGSYLYVESIGLLSSSPNKANARKFISYMLGPEAQQLVIYKMGLFPSNTKTFLPMHFTSVPFSTYTVNGKLKQSTIMNKHTEWLSFWDRLYSFRIVRESLNRQYRA